MLETAKTKKEQKLKKHAKSENHGSSSVQSDVKNLLKSPVKVSCSVQLGFLKPALGSWEDFRYSFMVLSILFCVTID